MKVKFKANKEPCTQYTVVGEAEDEWDDVQKKYCICLNLKELGWVEARLLEETNHPDNIDAIDIIVELSK